MARIISAEELCNCPDKVTELCSDNCKHRRPWGTGKSLLERFQAQQQAHTGWTTETTRAGITLESLSDDLGVFGAPGTWYRVSDGTERKLLVTRNRGDALRHFQRRVRSAH